MSWPVSSSLHCPPGAAEVTTGRRQVARLRLSIPAKLISIYDTRRCILIDISCGGAQIGLEEPLPLDDGVYLRIAGIEPFGIVVRSTIGPNGGVNGIAFDPKLSDEDVLGLRTYSEAFQVFERRALLAEARKWVMGA